MDLNDIDKIPEIDLNADLNIDKEEIKRDKTEDIVFSIKESDFNLPLRINTFESNKELDRFVKDVERMIRISLEYKYWIKYITEALGINECAFTYEKLSECKIEIHHHPITLYLICKAITERKIEMDQAFCTFDVATEVIELHFKNKVGYIPLLASLHEKYHKGFLQIPIEFVRGDFEYILNQYPFEDKDLDRICELRSITKSKCQEYWNVEKGYPSIME